MAEQRETHDDGGQASAADARPGQVPHLYVVLEADRPLAGGARFSLEGVDQVLIGRGSERRATRAVHDGIHVLQLELPAKSLSSTHARLLPTSTGWVVEDAGSRNGTFVRGERVERAGLGGGGRFEAGRVAFLLAHGRPAPDCDSASGGARTLDPELAERLSSLDQVATSRLFVLLEGETGSGKEVLARAIHERSRRRGRFVPVNCGALAEGVLASTLFGHRRGAFSGAVRDEPGLARESHGGTLFLDEIGELPRASQAALLRVLQDGEVLPVGDSRAIHVDLRVVAATNRSLEQDVAEGAFRPDLYARLTGFAFGVPALRDRPMDVGLLVAALLSEDPPGAAPWSLSPTFARHLVEHRFPFNVRELRQVLTAARVLSSNGVLDGGGGGGPSSAPPPRSPSGSLSPEDLRLRAGLLAALREHRGNVAAVARAMGKAPMQVHRWMKRFEVDPDAFRR